MVPDHKLCDSQRDLERGGDIAATTGEIVVDNAFRGESHYAPYRLNTSGLFQPTMGGRYDTFLDGRFDGTLDSSLDETDTKGSIWLAERLANGEYTVRLVV